MPAHVYAEIAFIAYHFHWSYDAILDLDHAERRRWCDEISRINTAMNADEHKKALSLDA